MGNYVIEDEIGEYSDYSNNSNNYTQSNDPKRKHVTIIVTVVVSILVLAFSLKNMRANAFSYYEKEMVSLAKDYVINNGIITNKEIYLDVTKLDEKLPNNCSLLSGVIYDGNNYEPYLLCSNYASKPFDNNYDGEIYDDDSFKLIGSDITFLLKGTEYIELGYEGNEDVVISNSNDIAEEGVYNIYYFSNNSSNILIRKIIVIDNPSLEYYFPTINSQNREEVVTMQVGTNYNDNIIAIDSVDGDLTDKMIKVSNLNALIPGDYRILYNVRNSLGYSTTLMKRIMVYDGSADMNIMTYLSNESITNDDVVIHVNVLGSGYSYTILPDGTTTSLNEFDYNISENGEYQFVAISNSGKESSKVVKITNIDKSVPAGTCVASISGNKVNVNVTVSSFNYVIGYNYYINNISSGYTAYNFYSSNVANANDIYVIVRDYVGNESNISCTVTDKQTFDPNGIRTVIRDKPRLHIPIGEALAKKGLTINDLNMCIYNRVKEAGPGTRWGVTAAAFGVIDCTYKMTGVVLPYNHTGGAVDITPDTNYCKANSDICGKLGISRKWGSPGGSCGASECWQGMNCATFVRWAMCNGGMNLCTGGARGAGSMISTQFFPEADGVVIEGTSVKHYSGQRLTNYNAETLVRMLKPGDVIYSTEGQGHAFVVVGYDSNGIYTAEDGYYMRNIKYSTLTNGEKKYRLFFLDRYYDNPKNRNNLYN